MPQIANHIEIRDIQGGFNRLVIDGEEFPWYVGGEIEASVRKGNLSTVTLTLLADRVTFAREDAADLQAPDTNRLDETIDQLRAELTEARSSRKVGTVHIEVQPDLSEFEAAVERAVKRAERKLRSLGSSAPA